MNFAKCWRKIEMKPEPEKIYRKYKSKILNRTVDVDGTLPPTSEQNKETYTNSSLPGPETLLKLTPGLNN